MSFKSKKGAADEFELEQIYDFYPKGPYANGKPRKVSDMYFKVSGRAWTGALTQRSLTPTSKAHVMRP